MANEEFQKDVENLSVFLMLVSFVGFMVTIAAAANFIWQNNFTLFILIVGALLLSVLVFIYLVARKQLKWKIKRSGESHDN